MGDVVYTNNVEPQEVAWLWEYELNERFRLFGLLDKERYIPPPNLAVQEERDVLVIVNESDTPITAFRHAPFPDVYEMREKRHPVMCRDAL